MTTLLQQASDALCRGDAVALEGLSVQAKDLVAQNLTHSERSALHQALLVFQRQVLAARTNLVMRRHLFAVHAAGENLWER